jgi:hypothetical protein
MESDSSIPPMCSAEIRIWQEPGGLFRVETIAGDAEAVGATVEQAVEKLTCILAARQTRDERSQATN